MTATTVYTLSAISIVSAGVYIAMRQRKLQDPYGDFHVSLNSDPSRPKSEWLNMGYWKDTESFPRACEALALKLAETAECEQGGHVLDVGHGSGDSLLLHLSHTAVPRPSHLTGITSLRSHHERSLQRVTEARDSPEPVHVDLYLGDAVYHPEDHSSTRPHPLNPSTSAGQYTSILALDCAYHFRTRHVFLSQAFTGLSPGGRVALADICFSSPPEPWFRAMLGGMGVMARENMVSKDEYVRSMEAIGYEDIKMEDISDEVFPGFTGFLRKRGLLWSVFAGALNWLVRRGARFVIVSGRKPTASSEENKA